MAKADVVVADCGSIYVVDHLTAAGKKWIAAHLPKDAPRIGEGVAVEHRYIRDIVVGMVKDGLKVQTNN